MEPTEAGRIVNVGDSAFGVVTTELSSLDLVRIRDTDRGVALLMLAKGDGVGVGCYAFDRPDFWHDGTYESRVVVVVDWQERRAAKVYPGAAPTKIVPLIVQERTVEVDGLTVSRQLVRLVEREWGSTVHLAVMNATEVAQRVVGAWVRQGGGYVAVAAMMPVDTGC